MRKLLLTTIFAASFAMGSAHAENQQLKMATVAPSLSQAIVMSTFANLVSENLDDITIEVAAGGAATVHAIEVGRGNLDLSMITPILYTLMQGGQRMYKSQADAPEVSRNVQLLTWFPGGPHHFAVRAESDILTLDDLEGASTFMGPQGGGAYNTAVGWVEATTGLQAGKDYNTIKATWQTGFQAFLDGKIDVYAVGCIDPCPQFIQFSETENVRFLAPESVEGEAVTKFMGKYRAPEDIPTGIYKNQKNETPIASQGTTYGIAVRSDIDEDTVYKMTKAFWDNVENITSDAPWAQSLNVKDAALKLGDITVHPGAARYYKEVGAM